MQTTNDPSAESAARVRILVIDDSPASRNHVIEALQGLPDMEVSIAESGMQALRAIKEGEYSLILCDYEMPDMSGLQVLRFVRTQHSALELPVLMLTSREEADVKVRAFRAGANDYIAKRAEPEELFARVATQIELLKAHRRLAVARARAAEGQRFEAVGHLAEALAHELNTPAQYIGDNLAFLSESFASLEQLVNGLRALDGDVTAAQIREAIDAADCDYIFSEVPKSIATSQQGIGQVSQIVAVMRDFGHRGGREPSPQDLNEIVRGALTVSHGQWHNSVTVTLELAPELPKVQCVGASIKQGVLRAILTAIKATAHADGSRRTDARLEIRTLAQPDSWVLLEIVDNGPELAPRPVPQQGLDSAPGTTLGEERAQALAFVRSVVVDEHAGQMQLVSRAPSGTCLILRLPVSHQTAPGRA